MSDTRVRVGGAVQYVADLPATGNDIGDRRIVLEPPAGAESTTYRWDGAAWVPENAPLSGTLRLYVDGTNGDDTAQGTSWATAWKTYARLESGLASILAPNPTALTTIVYVRGDFTGQDLLLSAVLHGRSRLHVLHHIDDWTEVASGTVATVAATTFQHGLREMTFNGIALDPAHEGCALVLEDGAGQRVVYQILRVWNNGGTMTATLSTSSAPPAWVTGGTASIREPSMVAGRVVHCALFTAKRETTTDILPFFVFGVAASGYEVESNVDTPVVPWVPTGAPAYLNGMRVFSGKVWTGLSTFNGYYMENALYVEYGFIGTNTDTGRIGGLLRGTSAVRIEAGAQADFRGVFIGSMFSYGGGGSIGPASVSGVVDVEGNGGQWAVSRSILCRSTALASGGVSARSNGYVSIATSSFLDLNAAGVGGGFFRCYRFGKIRVQSTVDGDNTGTAGSGLVVASCDDGEILFDGNPHANLKGKHGFLAQTDGRVRLQGNYSAGALEGGGPDLSVFGGWLNITGTVTKSATNPSGGGTAQPVLKVRRGGKVTMDATKAFTLPAGSGNNATDYGATGAIDISTCCDVSLGTLAGGAVGAVNTICTIKRASRLAHAGAAPAWGGAPIVVGGNAAAAWPADPVSDAAAGVPEDCWVLPASA